MALTESGGLSAADIAAIMGSNNGNNNGFGFGNDGAWWILILLLFGCFGGWGNNAGFGGGNNGFIPYMMGNQQNNDVQRVVDQQSVMSGINGLSAAMANGFSNAEISRCNANTNILQTLNNNQNAMTQGMNSLAMSLQNCCCENRAATADLKYTVATEACADRNAVQQAAQQLSNTYAQGNQAILDKLCQLEMDGVKQNYENRIASMQQNFDNRTAAMQNTIDMLRNKENIASVVNPIIANNEAQTAALENHLNPPARPAYVVQNPNCCAPQWNSCGCGM